MRRRRSDGNLLSGASRLLPVLVALAVLGSTVPASSQELRWARGMGGPDADEAFGVAVDAAGSVHSVGPFAGTADFNPGPGVFNLTAAGATDAFVAKLRC